MSKLTGKYEYRKDGKRHLKAYSASLTKTKVEDAGFSENTEIEIIYKKDKIEIIKK